MVEIDDPALEFEEAAMRVRTVFEQRLGSVWPEAVARLAYTMSGAQIGATRWIAVEGLHVGSRIAADVLCAQGVEAYIELIDRVSATAEQLLRRPPPPGEAAAESGTEPAEYEKPQEQEREAG